MAWQSAVDGDALEFLCGVVGFRAHIVHACSSLGHFCLGSGTEHSLESVHEKYRHKYETYFERIRDFGDDRGGGKEVEEFSLDRVGERGHKKTKGEYFCSQQQKCERVADRKRMSEFVVEPLHSLLTRLSCWNEFGFECCGCKGKRVWRRERVFWWVTQWRRLSRLIIGLFTKITQNN